MNGIILRTIQGYPWRVVLSRVVLIRYLPTYLGTCSAKFGRVEYDGSRWMEGLGRELMYPPAQDRATGTSALATPAKVSWGYPHIMDMGKERLASGREGLATQAEGPTWAKDGGERSHRHPHVGGLPCYQYPSPLLGTVTYWTLFITTSSGPASSAPALLATLLPSIRIGERPRKRGLTITFLLIPMPFQ